MKTVLLESKKIKQASCNSQEVLLAKYLQLLKMFSVSERRASKVIAHLGRKSTELLI